MVKDTKEMQTVLSSEDSQLWSAKKLAKIVHQIIVMYTKNTLLETNKDIEKIRTDLNFWGQKEESRKSASFVFSGVGG